MRKSDSQSGFTLMELLISVSIFALLMAMLFGGLQLGTRQVGRITAQVDRSAQIALVENFLRAQLAAAQPLAGAASGPKNLQFNGQPDGVDFVAAAPESLPAGGLQVLSVRFVAGETGRDGQLVVDWRPLRDDPDVPSPARTTVLLDHLRTARFVYYGPPQAKSAPDWQDTWQDMPYLPLLVRVSATFADGEPMPGLAVALRLSSTVAELQLNQGGRF
ncbi:MAG TPA: prepilin-type N-terminal cleavage/methylation domain-containing protein [Alphaproteobacteria bacterium]